MICDNKDTDYNFEDDDCDGTDNRELSQPSMHAQPLVKRVVYACSNLKEQKSLKAQMMKSERM